MVYTTDLKSVALRGLWVRVPPAAPNLCPSGETGRHVAFRVLCFGVGVRIPPWAPTRDDSKKVNAACS